MGETPHGHSASSLRPPARPTVVKMALPAVDTCAVKDFISHGLISWANGDTI